MAVMAVVGAVFVAGLVLTVWWGGVGYRRWATGSGSDPGGSPPPTATRGGSPPVGSDIREYARGVAVGLVGGFWAGALVTGPAMRLAMRLLAVTSGDDAQRRLTEADEIVGQIDLDGTIALWAFGGLLPGVLSGLVYVAVRRLLPTGRLGGAVFGALHLVLLATRVDPLRPDNPDFDLLGPGWLSVLTLGLACVVHGMAVAAIASRYSHAMPPDEPSAAAWTRAILPLVLPALLLVALVPVLVSVLIGLVVVVVLSRVPALVRAARGRSLVTAGRAVVVVVALLVLPATVGDLHDIVDRSRIDDPFLVGR